MPVPNTTPATATEILVSTLPFVTTQNVLDGTVQTVYFKITNDLTRDAVISMWFYGVIAGNPAIDYVADYFGYDDLAVSNQILDAYPNCYTEVPIPAGASWWIKVFPTGAGAGTPTLNMNVSLKPYSTTYENGNVVVFAASINTQYFIDHGGLHAGFINPTLSTPETRIVNFIPFFPACEHGDFLDTTYLLVDSFLVTQPPPTGSNMYCLLYSSGFLLITRVLITPPSVGNSFEPRVRSNLTTRKYWLGSPGFGGAPNRYATVGIDGTISAWTDLSVFPDGAATVACCVGNNDDTYLMIVRRATTFNYIYKWNLNTLAYDGHIGVEQAGYNPTDILAMADGTFIVCYDRNADHKEALIIQYNAAGTLLNSLSIPVAEAFTSDPRIGYARDTAYFWFWGPKNNGVSVLAKIKSSDFSVAINTTVPNVFATSIESATPPLIDVSDSCPIVEVLAFNPLSGLFFPEPGKTPRRDTYYDQEKKIPNPTVRSALLGD